jgi:hypothetical protein
MRVTLVARSFLYVALFLLLLSLPGLAFADPAGGSSSCGGSNGFVPLSCAQQSPLLQQAYNSNGLAQYVNALFKIALSAGAIMAVLRIAYGGFQYMGSADMWGSKADAKKVIRDAVIGLLILLSIYIILYQINPDIVKLDILKSFTPVPQVPSKGKAPAINPENWSACIERDLYSNPVCLSGTHEATDPKSSKPLCCPNLAT